MEASPLPSLLLMVLSSSVWEHLLLMLSRRDSSSLGLHHLKSKEESKDASYWSDHSIGSMRVLRILKETIPANI